MNSDLKKNLLIVAGFYYPSQVGGSCNSQYWLAKGFHQLGYNITVTGVNFGINEKEISLNKWHQVEYGKVIYIRSLFLIFSFRYIFTTIKEARKNNIAVLSSIFMPSVFISGIIMSFMPIKIVWSPRGELDIPVLSHKKRLKQIMIFILKKVKKKILFHSTCESETQYLKHSLGNDINTFQIPNYMSLPKQYGLKIEKYILFCGRVHPKKNLLMLIEAVSKSEIFKELNYKLKVIGDNKNDYGKLLSQKINELNSQNQIEFLGYIDDVELKNKLYSSAYFSIMPSITENFGNVVIESLAQGTPVIASKGTPWEELETSNAGLWVDANIDSLKFAIDQILNLDKDEYKLMRKNALDLVENKFSIHKNIFVWQNIFQKLI